MTIDVARTVFSLITAGSAFVLFFAILGFLEFGTRLGKRKLAKYGKDVESGVGVVDATVYGLLSLLIGFTFAGAAARFDHRRELIAEAVNAIGTAYLRVDVLPPAVQEPVREAFRAYMDALLAAYESPAASGALFQETEEMKRAQRVLWTRAIAACLGPGGEPARMLLLPSLNESFDAVEMEYLARRIHPPPIIFVMLGLAALAAAVFGGMGLAAAPKRNWIHIVGFAATIAIAVYVILEMEYPRIGLVQVTRMDQALVDLRASMR